MQVHVTFRHLDSSDALKKYAVDKSERMAKYLFEPIEIHWVLSVEKIRHLAEATIAANGVKINAQGDTQDMYSAIDMVIDKLEKQVRRHKEKIKDHKQHNSAEPSSIRFSPSPSPQASSSVPRIIKMENQFVKPMSVEEAVMQMDVAKNDFLVFTDSSTGNISVIYRTKGPDYGLIEAEIKK